MGGEESGAADVSSDVVKNGLGNCNTIIGACSTTEFIEDDEGSGCGLSEDLLGFRKLDEESALGSEDVVVSSET